MDRLLYVIGGLVDSPTGAVEVSDVHVLDTESWSWWSPQLRPTPLPPIAYHAAALTGDKIFVFGGSTRESLYNDLMAVDTSTGQWQVVERGDVSAARWAHPSHPTRS